MGHGQCLIEETFTDYLEGGLDPAVKAATEEHLIGCDQCRQRLAFYMRLLAQEVSADEETQLEVVRQQWDSLGIMSKLRHPARSWRRWIASFAGVAVGLLVGVLTFFTILEWQVTPNSPDEILNLLLSQQRPFEARISDQPYRRIIQTRTSEEAGEDYSLLVVEMTNLRASNHQMGRFYLTQKDFEKAIRYLEIAEQEFGAIAPTHNDLGVAYLEGGREELISKAAHEFRHALDLDPDFGPGLFNLAIYHERWGSTSEARAAWKRFLEIAPDSPWADEVRNKLEGTSR